VVTARQRPRLTWTAWPAWACSARRRYRVARLIPARRISSPTSVPPSGAIHSANYSASSALDGIESLSADCPVSGERISPAGSSAALSRVIYSGNGAPRWLVEVGPPLWPVGLWIAMGGCAH
jgi:hypothetical protein